MHTNISAEQAKALAKSYNKMVNILNENAMSKLGWEHKLFGEALKSAINLEYNGDTTKSAGCMVGKGITFDTGITIKPRCMVA